MPGKYLKQNESNINLFGWFDSVCVVMRKSEGLWGNDKFFSPHGMVQANEHLFMGLSTTRLSVPQ